MYSNTSPQRGPGPIDMVSLSSDSWSVFKLVLEMRTPVELMFAASEIGMWPPPRMEKSVDV